MTVQAWTSTLRAASTAWQDCSEDLNGPRKNLGELVDSLQRPRAGVLVGDDPLAPGLQGGLVALGARHQLVGLGAEGGEVVGGGGLAAVQDVAEWASSSSRSAESPSRSSTSDWVRV